MNGPRFPGDLTNDLLARGWQEYADASLTADAAEPVVAHARELAHAEDQ